MFGPKLSMDIYLDTSLQGLNYTHEELLARKQIDAYHYFHSGYVRTIHSGEENQ